MSLSTRFEIKSWIETERKISAKASHHYNNFEVVINYNTQTFIFTNSSNKKYTEIPDNCYICYINNQTNWKLEIYKNQLPVDDNDILDSVLYIFRHHKEELEKYIGTINETIKNYRVYSIRCHYKDKRFLNYYNAVKTKDHYNYNDGFYEKIFYYESTILRDDSFKTLYQMNEEYDKNQTESMIKLEHTDVISMDSTSGDEKPKLNEEIPNFYVSKEGNRVGYSFVSSAEKTHILLTDLSSRDEEVMFERQKKSFYEILSPFTYELPTDINVSPPLIRIMSLYKDHVEFLIRNGITTISK